MIDQSEHPAALSGVGAVTEAPVTRRRKGTSWLTATRASAAALTVLVVIAAYAAISLHRRGHTTGDDFALYLRQAQSLFEGNVAQVITDNRLLWAHSTAVTPQMYPWGFAMLLSPFVRLWGLDYDRLKLVEVACLGVWLVLFHGIARRRTDRIVALVVTAVFATAPLYLVHTDQLLTEFPHMLAVAVVIWWLDRVLQRHRLTRAPGGDLAILGLLMAVAYNFRRESVVFLGVVALAQLVDLVAERSHAVAGGAPSPWRRGRNPIGGVPWKRLAIPFATFAAGCAVAQLLLPSTLVPDNGNSRRFILTRLFNLNEPGHCPNPRDLSPPPRNCGNYPWHLLQQLGLTERPVYGVIIIGLAFGGAVIACAKAPRLNVPLAALMASTMLVIGTHFRMVSRYYFQVTPLIVLFVTILLVTAAREIASVVARRSATLRRAIVGVALLPVVWLTVIHLWMIPSRIDAAERFNDAGSVQSGPTNPRIAASFEMVLDHTRPDDIIVVRRARTLTLYTDRRALQLTSVQRMTDLADWYLQYKPENYSQPVATPTQLEDLGYELVDEDSYWRLWRIPHD